MSFASDIRDSLDAIRGIPGEMGLRPHSVTVRVTTWSGARVGLGTATTTSTALYVGAGAQNPKVRQLSQRDVIASGGKYTDQDLRVGPVTPSYTGGGVAHATLDPSTSSSPTEVRFLVEGPGFPSAGALCERVGDETDSALHYYLILRQTGQTP